MGSDWAVEIDPDGKIRVVRRPNTPRVEQVEEIVLW